MCLHLKCKHYTCIETKRLNKLKQVAEKHLGIIFEQRDSKTTNSILIELLREFYPDLELTNFWKEHNVDLDSLIIKIKEIIKLGENLSQKDIRKDIKKIETELETEVDPNSTQNPRYYIGKQYQFKKRPRGGYNRGSKEKTSEILGRKYHKKDKTIRRSFDYSKNIDVIREYLGDEAYLVMINNPERFQPKEAKNLATFLEDRVSKKSHSVL